MTPELLDWLKVVAPAAIASVGSFFLGSAKRRAELEQLKQQNKDSEFERLNRLVDEIQEENRGYRSELRELRSELRSIREQANLERDGYLRRIQQLEASNARLEAEVLELRAKQAH